jgi:hypothetical protein
MVTTDWADLNKDGRRLERIIKDMDKKAKTCTDKQLEFAYIDRIIKATNTKVNIAEIVLNVKKTLREAQKIAPTTVI